MDKKNPVLLSIAVLGGLLCITMGTMDSTPLQIAGAVCGLAAAVSAGVFYMAAVQVRTAQKERQDTIMQGQTEVLKSCTAQLEHQNKLQQEQTEMLKTCAAQLEQQKCAAQANSDKLQSTLQDVLHVLDRTESAVAAAQTEVAVVRERVDSVIESANAVFEQNRKAFSEAVEEWRSANYQMREEEQKMVEDELGALDEVLDGFHTQLTELVENWNTMQENRSRDQTTLYNRTIRTWKDDAEELLDKQEQLIQEQTQSLEKLSTSYENFQALTEQMLSTMNKSTNKDNQLVRELMQWSKTNGK